MSVQSILSSVSIWSILLPLSAGCLLRAKFTKDSILILTAVASGTIPQLLRAFISQSATLNLSYNIYTPVEFLLFYLLFHSKFRSVGKKAVFNLLTCIYFILSVVFLFSIHLTTRFINEWVCLNNLIYTTWILLYIIEQYEMTEEGLNIRQPFFWYLIAIFFYAPCTSLIFSSWNYIKHNPNSLLQKLLLIHSVFNIMMYLLFTIGLFKDAATKKELLNEVNLN